eukprot:7202580-Alexandrium_andersonii.AAC.1
MSSGSDASSSDIAPAASCPSSSVARRDSSSGNWAIVALTPARSTSSLEAKCAAAGTDAAGLLPELRKNSEVAARMSSLAGPGSEGVGSCTVSGKQCSKAKASSSSWSARCCSAKLAETVAAAMFAASIRS